jgi:hypothetical protein
MISPDLIGNQERPRSIPSSKLRLLIITDSDERLSKLKAALNTGEVEIACAASHDLVVMDVCPANLCGLLKTLRECPGCTRSPVLVEAERLVANTEMAGMLPKYRAMPCSHTDLVALSRHVIKPEDQEPRRRGLL